MRINLESWVFWTAVFGGVILIYGGFLAFSRWCFKGLPVPEERGKQLRVGMTAEEVGRLLGQPLRERRWDSGLEWHYGHRLQRNILVVRFGQDNRLVEFAYVSDYDFGRGQPV